MQELCRSGLGLTKVIRRCLERFGVRARLN
jgi:hypothetical protein